MIKLIIILAILIIFFGIKWLIFQFTDKKGLPDFLQYKPFVCYKCCSFWVLNFIYGVAIWITGEWGFLIGNGLAFLDGLAKFIDEKYNIIDIKDIEDGEME